MEGLRFAQALQLYGRVGAIALLALPGIALQRLFLALDSGLQASFPVFFHRYVARVVGLRCRVVGAPARERPLMLVSNHVSWLDITALSAVAPVSFIAKSEVASWGIFGLFARLQRSIFVERERRSATQAVNARIASRLHRGDIMVLFAEGTTGDGVRVLPFRSALIGAARDVITASGSGARTHETMFLQPVSIAYTRLDGLPAGRYDRPHTAWYGDMTLVPHLKAVLTGGPLDVTISFGEPRAFTGTSDRKTLTRQLEEEVRSMTVAAHNGRRPEAG